MITKLKTAGLGWHDEDAKESEKLGKSCAFTCCVSVHVHAVFSYIYFNTGKISLRDLVYRVLELPASMRALVYDFGSLKPNIQSDYIKKIVSSRVSIFEPQLCTFHYVIYILD